MVARGGGIDAVMYTAVQISVTPHKSIDAEHFVYFGCAEQTSNALANPDPILFEMPMECYNHSTHVKGGGGEGHGWLDVSDIFSLLTIVTIFSLNRLLPVVYIF